MRSLLDINVIIALFDTAHQHHRMAHDWFNDNIQDGWASCPITQNGFVRIITQTNYPRPITLPEAIERLEQATRNEHHSFWPDEISITSKSHFLRTNIHGPRQLTDLYLLALAKHRRGRFVTLDRSIPLNALSAGHDKHLLLL